MELIYSGSVKEMYQVPGKKQVEFQFTDKISVFDKPIPSLIPHKGETLCRTAVHWFRVAETMGIKTHFIEQVSSHRIRVKQVDIIRDYSKMTSSTVNYLVPCEFITRYYVAGSLNDRIKSGQVTAQELGWREARTIQYGEKLPQPFFETTTKLERVDRKIDFAEAMTISGIDEATLNTIRDTILRLDDRINTEVADRGLIHVDGKKEFGLDENRSLMILDVFGTADEDRFWDAAEYSRGEWVELSKEVVRQYYRKIGYKDALYDARDKGQPEPDIPPLPDDVIAHVSEVYISLYEKITGKKF
ncbi:MAG TPA: phosphoribosylaminoimidazolesuccinocarboxamide synthase [Thermodesulfobacteriota bacterium]|nr:phosphoribosylaminoimidazolesuccinocarboxamide synthase [Thermodesulfobacteriota bacterium]HOC39076.1 phosphoribosylaminoimidazolesuccinocarboxamide synthase [Thermodesulfobacteriota bacterium]HQO77067.1 phosphoribosylaminoimidazolesuccinocarboxamide synthase [Thermodesulfobacteriota bacterium]